MTEAIRASARAKQESMQNPAAGDGFHGKESDFTNRALERLRLDGFRITMPRLQVLRVLGDSEVALTVQEIHARVVQQGGRMDIASVYRTLATLVEKHLVHHVGVVDGFLACRFEDHHSPDVEHAVCQRCRRVTEVEVGEDVRAATQEVLKKIGFAPSSIKVEVSGICSHCR